MVNNVMHNSGNQFLQIMDLYYNHIKIFSRVGSLQSNIFVSQRWEIISTWNLRTARKFSIFSLSIIVDSFLVYNVTFIFSRAFIGTSKNEGELQETVFKRAASVAASHGTGTGTFFVDSDFFRELESNRLEDSKFPGPFNNWINNLFTRFIDIFTVSW